MLVSLWSVKGGVGTSSVAAMLALARAACAEPAVLVDLCGDLPALLGLAEPDGPGVGEWCETPSRSPDALARIELDVAPDCTLLPRGRVALPDVGSSGALADVLGSSSRCVVVDAGLAGVDPTRQALVAASAVRLLVLRPCYLALRAARSGPLDPTGVVLVTERGRALSRLDVETVVEAPVVAEIAHDIAIARAIDAGLVTSRLPRGLLRSLGSVLRNVA